MIAFTGAPCEPQPKNGNGPSRGRCSRYQAADPGIAHKPGGGNLVGAAILPRDLCLRKMLVSR